MQPLSRILITPGEPSGIGPDIVLQIAQQSWNAEIIAVCDPTLLALRAKQIDLPIQILPFNLDIPTQHKVRTIKCIPVALQEPCVAGKLNAANAHYVLECLNVATRHCLMHPIEKFALVTGPIQKSIINSIGIAFTGHTEYLAQLCDITHPIMLFVADKLRVALATTHLPLAEVPAAITGSLLENILRILHAELIHKFKLSQPRITVCGLNPHAGENGHLGREEIEVISPTLDKLRKQGMLISGPLPADTIFNQQRLAESDAILAMYHDQALPTVKYASFGHAVNVTLGLPITRTSVDHGTALDIAGTGKADAGSLAAAVELALTLL